MDKNTRPHQEPLSRTGKGSAEVETVEAGFALAAGASSNPPPDAALLERLRKEPRGEAVRAKCLFQLRPKHARLCNNSQVYNIHAENPIQQAKVERNPPAERRRTHILCRRLEATADRRTTAVGHDGDAVGLCKTQRRDDLFFGSWV